MKKANHWSNNWDLIPRYLGEIMDLIPRYLGEIMDLD